METGRKNTLEIPRAYRHFKRVETWILDQPHIAILIDIPNKVIYINRAAEESANVVHVRFRMH